MRPELKQISVWHGSSFHFRRERAEFGLQPTRPKFDGDRSDPARSPTSERYGKDVVGRHDGRSGYRAATTPILPKENRRWRARLASRSPACLRVVGGRACCGQTLPSQTLPSLLRACRGTEWPSSSAQNTNARPSKPTAAAVGTSATAETVGRPRRGAPPGHSLKKSPETDTSRDSRFAQWQIAVKVPIERQFQRRCSAKPRSPLRTSTLCN